MGVFTISILREDKNKQPKRLHKSLRQKKDGTRLISRNRLQ